MSDDETSCVFLGGLRGGLLFFNMLPNSKGEKMAAKPKKKYSFFKEIGVVYPHIHICIQFWFQI